MYETSIALDPVATFEFYLCKTQPDCKSLFQSLGKVTTKNINFANPRGWYRNEPVWGKYHQQDDGKDFYQSRVIRAVHELLHSPSTVTSLLALFQHGVDARKVCAITKHKDKRSFTHYISETTSTVFKKILSDTVSAAARCSARSFRNHEAKCHWPVSRS